MLMFVGVVVLVMGVGAYWRYAVSESHFVEITAKMDERGKTRNRKSHFRTFRPVVRISARKRNVWRYSTRKIAGPSGISSASSGSVRKKSVSYLSDLSLYGVPALY
jgi:hypothetical protein